MYSSQGNSQGKSQLLSPGILEFCDDGQGFQMVKNKRREFKEKDHKKSKLKQEGFHQLQGKNPKVSSGTGKEVHLSHQKNAFIGDETQQEKLQKEKEKTETLTHAKQIPMPPTTVKEMMAKTSSNSSSAQPLITQQASSVLPSKQSNSENLESKKQSPLKLPSSSSLWKKVVHSSPPVLSKEVLHDIASFKVHKTGKETSDACELTTQTNKNFSLQRQQMKSEMKTTRDVEAKSCSKKPEDQEATQKTQGMHKKGMHNQEEEKKKEKGENEMEQEAEKKKIKAIEKEETGIQGEQEKEGKEEEEKQEKKEEKEKETARTKTVKTEKSSFPPLPVKESERSQEWEQDLSGRTSRGRGRGRGWGWGGGRHPFDGQGFPFRFVSATGKHAIRGSARGKIRGGWERYRKDFLRPEAQRNEWAKPLKTNLIFQEEMKPRNQIQAPPFREQTSSTSTLTQTVDLLEDFPQEIEQSQQAFQSDATNEAHASQVPEILEQSDEIEVKNTAVESAFTEKMSNSPQHVEMRVKGQFDDPLAKQLFSAWPKQLDVGMESKVACTEELSVAWSKQDDHFRESLESLSSFVLSRQSEGMSSDYLSNHLKNVYSNALMFYASFTEKSYPPMAITFLSTRMLNERPASEWIFMFKAEVGMMVFTIKKTCPIDQYEIARDTVLNSMFIQQAVLTGETVEEQGFSGQHVWIRSPIVHNSYAQ